MKEDVLVSIIIPVYNVRPYLTEALDSAINQTYNNIEIIIIDDGSTDGSEIVCDEYKKQDKRIQIIHQENKGLSAARNIGLRMATGEYVVFMDSDDAYSLDFVSIMVNAIISNNSDLVICRCSIHRTNNKMTQSNSNSIEPRINCGEYNCIETLHEYINGSINAGVWNKIYKKNLWNNIEFPVGRFYEDQDTMFRIISLCDRVCVIDQPLYFYRKRSDSITATITHKNIDDCIIAYTNLENYIKVGIPEYFTEKELLLRRNFLLTRLICNYISTFSIINNYFDKSSIKYLRKRIIQLVGKKEKKILSHRMKLFFYLIKFCPHCVTYGAFRTILYIKSLFH